MSIGYCNDLRTSWVVNSYSRVGSTNTIFILILKRLYGKMFSRNLWGSCTRTSGVFYVVTKYWIPKITVLARARQTSLTALKKVAKVASRRRCPVSCRHRQPRHPPTSPVSCKLLSLQMLLGFTNFIYLYQNFIEKHFWDNLNCCKYLFY